MMLRRRMMGQHGGGGLPYDARVAYLKSTGTQRITLPISISAGDFFEISGEFYPQGTGTMKFLIGANASSDIFANIYSIGTSSYTYATAISGNATNGGMTFPKDQFSTFALSTEGKTVNGVFSALARPIKKAIQSIVLFSTDTAMVKWFKIKVGSDVVYDLIPVRVGQVGYMYDRISGEMFGNVGTGKFVLGPDADSYIQSGLVFQLDGIDWGGIAGHWIERKNGYDWYEHNGTNLHTEDDCMVFDGSSWFICDDTIASYSDSTHSIEGVFSAWMSGWRAILYLRNNNVALWQSSSSNFSWAKGSSKPAISSGNLYGGKKHLYGFSNKAIVNGVEKEATVTTSRTAGSGACIGGLEKSTANSYHLGNGTKVYAIRIYNRELTEDEVAHNYEIDRLRFNF